MYLDSFLQGMRDLGYVEGRQFDMVTRFSGGYQDRIASQTAEVVSLKPDVIVATAAINVIAVKKLTSTIPIVSGALADAVDLGLIASDARPGGNVTGIEPYIAGLPAKQMEIAREIVAGASKIGILTNLSDPKAPPQVRELEAAARGLEVKVVTADASRPDAIATAMGKLADERVDVVIVLQTSMLLSENRLISASAIERRLPTVCGYREHVLSGGLISYGVDLRWCFNRTAYLWTRSCAVPRWATCRGVSIQTIAVDQPKNRTRAGPNRVARADQLRRRSDRIDLPMPPFGPKCRL